MLGKIMLAASIASGQGVAVPAYFYPGPLWDQLDGASVVVANPFSGPGKDFDPNYAAALRKARDAGITVLGYVATGYLGSTGRATRLGESGEQAWLAQSQQDVETWYRLYGEHGLGGVFLDEVQNVCQYAGTYRWLDRSIKSLHRGAFTVINPGIGTEECYSDIGDVSLTFEGTYDTYRTWQPPKWQRGLDPRRFWHLVHAAATREQMADAMRLGKQRGAGFIYVTPDVLANPWDTLPDYWQEELAAARSSDTRPPGRPLAPVALARTSTSLTLAWPPVRDAVGYDVYVDGLRVTGTAGRTPAVTLRDLEPGTGHAVSVRARDEAGNASPASRAVQLTTRAATGAPPAAPAGLEATEVKVASVRLAWPAVQGAASYDVRLDGRILLRLPAGTTRTPVSGLTPGGTYTFTVTARDAAGNVSAPAGPLTVTTPVPTGEPITDASGTIEGDSVTYRAQYTLPFDFHHVYVDTDNDAATGFGVAGVGAEYLIENGWYYRHAGSGWNWTPVEGPSPLVSSADDLYVWRVPRGEVGPHRVVFHGSGSSPEAYSPIVTVE